MLKKIFSIAILVATCSSVFAKSDIEVQGQITSVDDAKKTITLSGVNGDILVQIFPHTELKGDDCGVFGRDVYEKFPALKVGMFVEVEGYPQANNVLGAKEVEWKCGKKAH
ncbi:MAG: DUF5666 domain-containing protein [Helicobacteraceae bacterium]|nr:DUF5666 domain-containing protein [Helicobacteraceae bacterium]